MKQALLSLITILVFAGVCAYLLQKLRTVEKKLVHVRQLSSQLCGVQDVHKITASLFQKRDQQLKLQHIQIQEQIKQQQTSQQASQQPSQPIADGVSREETASQPAR